VSVRGEQPHTTATFEAFFADVHRDLYAALCLLTRDRHEAEEIAQEALVKVLERWDRVGRMDDPKAYLYRVAMNVFRKHLRRSKLLARLPGGSGSDDGMAAIEDRDELVRLLQALTPRQRAAVVLTEGLGFTSEEAAGMLGIKGSTVRVLAARAREQLKGGEES